MKRYLIFFTLVIINIYNNDVYSQIQIPGSIADTLVLSDTTTYYYSSGNVSITVGGKLVIEKNVTIKMAPTSIIGVSGTLEINGNKENPVLITSSDTNSFWGYINSGSGDVNLIGVNVTCAKKFLNANYGRVKLIDCNVDNTYGTIGDDCIAIHYSDSVQIKGCNLNGNPSMARIDAIDCDGIHNAIILNNTITNFEDDGIDFGTQATSSVIENNFIFNCNFGVSVGENSNIIAARNIVVGCWGGGFQVHTGATLNAVQNTLFKNAKGFELHHGGTANSGGNLLLNSCVVSGSNVNYTMQSNSSLSAKYSLCDTDTLPGNTNILGFALFKDSVNHDFSLTALSPCINNGDPLLPLDIKGNFADIGAVEFYNDSVVDNASDVKLINIKIFPNPCSSFLKVVNLPISNDKYFVCNLDGKEIKSGDISVNSDIIQTSDLIRGTYVLIIKSSTSGSMFSTIFVVDE
ncbi:MAG: right-handed parallel beta-helix repeat-containing protein [Marinilabiliaceae bacterium]|nr:right-handed parallel beta-helix repeat-containing protein [Marinilabiliaceae bacterium]